MSVLERRLYMLIGILFGLAAILSTIGEPRSTYLAVIWLALGCTFFVLGWNGMRKLP